MKRMLLLFGHPEPRSFNAQLAAGYLEGARAAGAAVERIDLATLRYDPVSRAEAAPLEPDLLRVREAIERAEHLAWIFPTWWSAPPAFVRAVVERVFTPDWAFRYEGSALPRGLLAGRAARVIVTMDSPWWWYTAVNHRPIHRSFGSGTLAFCGLSPVELTTIHRVRDLGEDARARWVEAARALGARDARARVRATPRELGKGARLDLSTAVRAPDRPRISEGPDHPLRPI